MCCMLMIIYNFLFYYRQHELCLQLRDNQNSEYLGELFLDMTLTPQSREEREQVKDPLICIRWIKFNVKKYKTRKSNTRGRFII